MSAARCQAAWLLLPLLLVVVVVIPHYVLLALPT